MLKRSQEGKRVKILVNARIQDELVYFLFIWDQSQG